MSKRLALIERTKDDTNLNARVIKRAGDSAVEPRIRR